MPTPYSRRIQLLVPVSYSVYSIYTCMCALEFWAYLCPDLELINKSHVSLKETWQGKNSHAPVSGVCSKWTPAIFTAILDQDPPMIRSALISVVDGWGSPSNSGRSSQEWVCPTISHHTRVSQIIISHDHALPYYIILYRNHIIYYLPYHHIIIPNASLLCLFFKISLFIGKICYLCAMAAWHMASSCHFWTFTPWASQLHHPQRRNTAGSCFLEISGWYHGDIMGIYHQQYTNNMFWVYHWIGLRECRNSDWISWHRCEPFASEHDKCIQYEFMLNDWKRSPVKRDLNDMNTSIPNQQGFLWVRGIRSGPLYAQTWWRSLEVVWQDYRLGKSNLGTSKWLK